MSRINESNPLRFIDPTGLRITVAGTPEYRGQVAAALRQLDPLAEVDLQSGEVTLSKGPSRKDRQYGHELLTRLVSNERTVTIGGEVAALRAVAPHSRDLQELRESWGEEGWMQPPRHPHQNLEAASDTGSFVGFKPGDRSKHIPVKGAGGRVVEEDSTKGFIGLAHELIHAEHRLRPGWSGGQSWQLSSRLNVREEKRTVGVAFLQFLNGNDITENMIRREHASEGVRQRAQY